MRINKPLNTVLSISLAASLAACSEAPDGLRAANPAATTVKFDIFHRPLPEIPLPNDIATRYDPSSPTLRRINASMIAPTQMESRVRRLIDNLDGWGSMQPIVIPFTGPLMIESITNAHDDEDYDLTDDVVYLINVDKDSERYGQIYHLDVGNGNYPVILEEIDGYWKNDPRGDTISVMYEDVDEDLNGNGVLDQGEDLNGNGELDEGEDLNDNGVLDWPEDTDADGLLDTPNYLPGHSPARDDLAGRSDALMTFYEKQTNTLIVNSMMPLDERTTYAVVVTERLLDADGAPVGSPFEGINHTAQTKALENLPEVLPDGVAIEDVAFAFSFTTQTLQQDFIAVRDGLYGHGVQAHLATEFPAEIDTPELARDRDTFRNMRNPHIVYGETWAQASVIVAQAFLGKDDDSEFVRVMKEQLKYVDYFVIGKFKAPQLFEREDADGNLLPLDEQSWPKDVSTTPVKARSEDIYYTLVVPRKEISNRGDGKPADVVVLSHGYTGNRFDAINFAGVLARHGLATIAIDGPSHGLPLSDSERQLAMSLLEGLGISPMGEAVFKDRAFDQNADGANDSGADFWTSYVFHTRDMVRQFTLDYMQLARIIRSFDGQNRWDFDINNDGTNDLAGDFDGDGVVDIGMGSSISAVGGSLGGMMSTLMGGLEPEIDQIVPISGGGKLANVGIRSRQGGVREAFLLRVMGPLFVGTIEDDGRMLVENVVADLNDDHTEKLGYVSGVNPGDTMVVENLINGELGCGYVQKDGRVRAGVAADLHDRIQVRFYAGPQLTGDEECSVNEGVEAKVVFEKFDADGAFQGFEWGAGDALVAIAEGLGLERAHPDLRRFGGLGQLVLDACDPATYARHIQQEPLTYPGTGHTTGAHALVITTIGDMSVPASSGVTVARAAGLVDYLKPDDRYGKPLNQVLLDSYVAESVNTNKRFVDPNGVGIHLDVENFGQGTDHWGASYPRLDPPLRIGFGEMDPLGGKSAAIFPMGKSTGEHGFSPPGEMTDDVRRSCRRACTTEGDNDPCGCNAISTFDIGHFLFNMSGRYARSHGQVLDYDLCQSRDDCADLQPPPEPRDVMIME